MRFNTQIGMDQPDISFYCHEAYGIQINFCMITRCVELDYTVILNNYLSYRMHGDGYEI